MHFPCLKMGLVADLGEEWGRCLLISCCHIPGFGEGLLYITATDDETAAK